MNGQEKNIIGKIRVNELLTAVLEVVISVLILLLEMNMRTAGFSAAFRDFMAQPKLWAVNLFPISFERFVNGLKKTKKMPPAQMTKIESGTDIAKATVSSTRAVAMLVSMQRK